MDESRKDGKKSPVQSIDRAVQILRCFEKNPKLRLADICEMVELHKSTTFGILSALKTNGLLDQDAATDEYCLGPELMHLASLAMLDIRQICLPHILEINSAINETVNVVVPDGVNIMYIEKKEGGYSMRSSTRIGKRLPMYCTAVGKALLAYMPREKAQPLLDLMQFSPFTKYTVTSKELLIEQLAEIRENGYAIEREEVEYGLACVAVPVVNRTGVPICAISVSVPIQRMNKTRMTQIAELLQEHVRQIEYIL